MTITGGGCYPRRPVDVLWTLPDYWHRVRAVVIAVQRRIVGGDSPGPEPDGPPVPEPEVAVTSDLQTVVQATRFALGAFAVGLATAVAAVPFDGPSGSRCSTSRRWRSWARGGPTGPGSSAATIR